MQFFQSLKNHENFAYPFNTELLALDINKENLRGFLSLSHSSRMVFGICYIIVFCKFPGQFLL